MRGIWFWLAAMLVLAALMVAACQPTQIELRVEGERGGLSIAVPANDVIQLTFIHSVELTPVIEIYRVQDDGLVLVETRSRSFGWGLPSSEPGYRQVTVDNQIWFAFTLERRIGVLRIITDPANDYTLHAAGAMVKLADFGRSVMITAGR